MAAVRRGLLAFAVAGSVAAALAVVAAPEDGGADPRGAAGRDPASTGPVAEHPAGASPDRGRGAADRRGDGAKIVRMDALARAAARLSTLEAAAEAAPPRVRDALAAHRSRWAPAARDDEHGGAR